MENFTEIKEMFAEISEKIMEHQTNRLLQNWRLGIKSHFKRLVNIIETKYGHVPSDFARVFFRCKIAKCVLLVFAEFSHKSRKSLKSRKSWTFPGKFHGKSAEFQIWALLSKLAIRHQNTLQSAPKTLGNKIWTVAEWFTKKKKSTKKRIFL